MQISFGNRAVIRTNDFKTANNVIDEATSKPELFVYNLSSVKPMGEQKPYDILICDGIDKKAIEQLGKNASEFSQNVCEGSRHIDRIADMGMKLYDIYYNFIQEVANSAIPKNIDELSHVDTSAIKNVLGNLFKLK